MSEHRERSKGMKLVSRDPFRSPTELMGNEDSMRRLFLVHFSCPLCGQEHSCEMYLTLVTQNEDEMMEMAVQTFNRDDVKVNSLAPFMKEYHEREGDYLQRATAYAKQEVRYSFEVTAVAMTDEESYTCEHCSQKFETIGAWRRHDGKDSTTGQRLKDSAGTPLCQRHPVA